MKCESHTGPKWRKFVRDIPCVPCLVKELETMREHIGKCRLCSEKMKLYAVKRQDFVMANYWRERT